MWSVSRWCACAYRVLSPGTAQCAHATLGAYRRAVKHFPDALWAWETFGQAKIALQVPNEEDM